MVRVLLLDGWVCAIAAALFSGLLAAALFVSLPVAAQVVTSASGVPPGPARPVVGKRSEDGIRWQALTPAQREVLAPLEKEWRGIDASRKQKWIVLAARFRMLGPAEQGRITERMSEWARMSPVERGQARIRFEEARQVPAEDRNARWQAYQALPADARERLATRAASAASSGQADAGRRDGRTAAKPARDSVKANLVPNPTLVPAPRQVAPTLVQAAPGATTTLITRRPAPPVHQQTGMPKIAGTPEFVNRSTLLPKRGPQAAAVTPPAPAGAGGLVVSPVLVPSTPVVVPAVPGTATVPTAPAASGAR